MEWGPIASFHAAMAAALYGNKTYALKVIAELQQNFPHVTAVTQYYVPEWRPRLTLLGTNRLTHYSY